MTEQLVQGLTAFIHDLTGSRANVDLENEEGGLHEFPENLATEWCSAQRVGCCRMGFRVV